MLGQRGRPRSGSQDDLAAADQPPAQQPRLAQQAAGNRQPAPAVPHSARTSAGAVHTGYHAPGSQNPLPNAQQLAAAATGAIGAAAAQVAAQQDVQPAATGAAGAAAGGVGFQLPPLNNSAAFLASTMLGLPQGYSAIGNFLCCRLCSTPDCEPSCPSHRNTILQQALYEYIVLHEPLTEGVASYVPFSELGDEEFRQQSLAARAQAVSSRTPQQMAQDLAECRQLFGLPQGVLPGELVNCLSDSVRSLLTIIADRAQQRLLQQAQQQQQAPREGGDIMIRWGLHRLLHLEVLEMTPMDLDTALHLLEQAYNSLPSPAQPPGTTLSSVQNPNQATFQGESVARIQAAVKMLLSHLKQLQEAFKAQPGKVRKLARYLRAHREVMERRQLDDFTASWDYAEGGAAHPVAAEGAVTLFVRSSVGCPKLNFSMEAIMTGHAEEPGISELEAMEQLAAALRQSLQLPEPQQQQQQHHHHNNTQDDSDFDEDAFDEDEEGEVDDLTLRDAAGRVAAVLRYTPYQDFYRRGHYFIITVQPGFNAQAAKTAAECLGWSCFQLQHGVTQQMLPQLPARAAPAAAAAAAAGDGDGRVAGGLGWTSVDCYLRARAGHAAVPYMGTGMLLRTAAEVGLDREERLRHQLQQQQRQAAAAQGAAPAAAGAAAAAAGAPGADNSEYIVQVTSGGQGPQHEHPSSLFIVREAAGEGREVAKALVTYTNPEMEHIGPALELIEVKGRWRGRGLARRLVQVIEGHVLSMWPPPRAEMGASQPHGLMPSYVIGSRGFFTALGFKWLDAPLCEEGLKDVFLPPQPCSCGQCADGVLSKRMRDKLADTAQSKANDLREDIKYAERNQLFGVGRGPLARRPLRVRDLLNSRLSIEVLPRQTKRQHLYKTFLTGYAECLDAIALALETLPSQLPTPLQVMNLWPRVTTHWSTTAQQFFLERGGSVELALAHVIDATSHLDGDDFWGDEEFDDEEEQVYEGPLGAMMAAAARRPRCSNDRNFNAVFDALVGGLVPRRVPGCVDCGTKEPDDDDDDSDGC